MELEKYYSLDVYDEYRFKMPALTGEGGEDKIMYRKVGVIDSDDTQTNEGIVPHHRFLKVFCDFQQDGQWKEYQRSRSNYHLQLEEWRYCPGLSKKYQVSSLGRIRRRFGNDLVKRKFRVPVWNERRVGRAGDRIEKELKNWEVKYFYDWEWEVLRPEVGGDNSQNAFLFQRVRWSRDTDAAEHGVRNGCMFGGKCAKIKGAEFWLAENITPKDLLCERIDFLVLCTFAKEGNALWKWKKDLPYWQKVSLDSMDSNPEMHLIAKDMLQVPDIKQLHFNGRKWDCSIFNLKWGSTAEQYALKGYLTDMNDKAAVKYVSPATKKRIDELLNQKINLRVPMTLQEIADRVGTSISTVSRRKTEFEAANEGNEEFFAEQRRVAKLKEEGERYRYLWNSSPENWDSKVYGKRIRYLKVEAAEWVHTNLASLGFRGMRSKLQELFGFCFANTTLKDLCDEHQIRLNLKKRHELGQTLGLENADEITPDYTVS